MICIEQTGPETPEIVIDARYGTSDTTMSTESGYLSEGGSRGVGFWPSQADVFDIGPLDELTQLRLLGKSTVSLYRWVVFLTHLRLSASALQFFILIFTPFRNTQ